MVLKTIGALSVGAWIPCVELDGEMRLCVVCRPHPPWNSAIDVLRMKADAEDGFVLRKVRDGHVQVAGVDIIADPALQPPAWDAVGAFVGALMRDRVGGPYFSERIRRAAWSALEVSHGALYAVAERDQFDTGVFTSNATLDPPVDLHGGELTHAGDNTTISAARFEQVRDILRAVTSMDGIVVCSTDGYLLAYRCFVSAETGAGAGGARGQAFRHLTENLKDKFVGVLMRSQDGATKWWPTPG